jgi:chemotaxis family two-component system response regulator Rcp1
VTGRPIDILLVDDDPADVAITTRLLERSKVRNRITSVGDGHEALAYLRGEAPHEDATVPDLILLDLNMPVLDGHGVLEAMKNDATLSHIPVVILTTSDQEEDVAKSYGLHANAYITKPIGLDQLARVVEAIESFWFEVVRLPDSRGRTGST